MRNIKIPALLTMLLAAIYSFGQTTHTFPALDTTNIFTGLNTFTLTTTFGDVVINGTCTGTGCASGAGGYATIQNAGSAIAQRAIINLIGAIACVDNAGSLRSDCKLSQNNAVTNQYLTGIDASGAFLRKQIDYAELSSVPATFPATSHNLLSATHGDTTTGTVARGDLITGQTATPKWARLAKGTANQLLAMDATGTDIVWAAPPGGTGTVTSFSAGNAAPLFTTSVATATTTPALTFNMTAAAAHTFYMNNTAGSATPGFQTAGKADLPATAVYTDQSNTYSAGTTQAMDTATAKYWGSAPVFDATKYAGADMCAKILAVYSDAAYLASTIAIVDATGFTGNQNCASNFLAVTRDTWIKLADVTLHVTVNLATPFSVGILAAPAIPTTNTTTTTGGTLSNAVFVRTGYVTAWTNENSQQFGPSPELTVTMGGACAGTPTCTASMNSPAAVVGAYAYNIFQSNTAGAEKKCNVAPIPLGVVYKITANCAGVAVNTSNLVSYVAVNMLSGVGDNTQISLEDPTASIDAVTNATWNWTFKDFSLVSTLTTQSVNGMLQLGNSQQVDNITFSGGGNHLYVVGSMDTIRRTRHYGFTQTTGPVFGIGAFNVKWLRIEDTTFSNFTFPVSATTNYGIQLNQCYMCTVDGERSDNIDNSLAVNGGSMLVATGDNTVANASSHILFANFTCDFLINVNCADFTGMTHHAQMLNGDCNFTNNSAGVGANILGADCYDIFMTANYTLTNLKGSNRGGPGGACCPTVEIYSSTDGTLNGVEASDDKSNEGIRVVGSPALSFNGVITSRNTNSGVVLADATTVVTCNGTTTVAWVSGQPFGPWKFNQQAGIGAGPTFFNIDHTVDSHTLILTTTCGLGASQAFFVATGDFSSTGFKADDNGQAGTGAGVRTGLAEGYYVSGHSQASLTDGSCNDNAPIAANKHQQYCVRTENNARVRASVVDMTGNGGGSNCLLEGNNVAGNHTYCDSTKLSSFLLDDNVGPKWTMSASQTTDASLNIPAGVAPTTPAAGDIWNDGTAFANRDPTTGINQYLPKKIYLTGNYTNSTTSLTNVTSGNTLAFAVAASKDYAITCELFYQAASTGGLQIAFTGPASPTAINYSAMIATTATTINNGESTAFGTKIPTTGVASTATTNFPAHISLMLRNGANAGTVTLQAASVAAVQLTINNTSFCTIQ